MLLQGTLALPIWAAFLFLGTALWAWGRTADGQAPLAELEPSSYGHGVLVRAFPIWQALLAEGADVDALVSTFALSHLPAGAGGLVLAGVMVSTRASLDEQPERSADAPRACSQAAAMSSLDSSTNAVAASVAVDWVQRLHLRGAPLPEAMRAHAPAAHSHPRGRPRGSRPPEWRARGRHGCWRSAGARRSAWRR